MAILLKSLQWFLRAVEFLCSALILALTSYFLATLSSHNLPIPTSLRAIEGISGAATLYSIVGLLFLFCLSGLALFSFIAIVLDWAFLGAFVYVAWENRKGAGSCTGNVETWFGNGDASERGAGTGKTSVAGDVLKLPELGTACKLETAIVSVAIIAIVIFLLSSGLEFLLARHHQREKAFGPSPKNNYTSGRSGLRLPKFLNFKRTPKEQIAVNPDALPLHQTPADFTTTHVPLEEGGGKEYEQGVNSSPYHSGGGGAAAGGYGQSNPYSSGAREATSNPYSSSGANYDRFGNGGGAGYQPASGRNY